MALAVRDGAVGAGRAAIYARISKDEAGDALGVERQVKLCRDLARSHGLHVAADDVLVDNDMSAYAKRRRPQFERLVDMLDNREVDAVVVYHSDRLYRRTRDLERLVDVIEGGNTTVHTVAAGLVDLSTASGRMVARMLGAAAQHESERMGERIQAKMDELAAKGTPPSGPPPYGYAPGYVVDESERDVLQLMARRVLEGASLLRVARELDAAGIKPRKAAKWNSTSIRTALLNPAVIAQRIHRREVAGPGTWEPVLDRDTYEKLRAVLADPSRKHTRPARKYLLAGLVFTPEGDQMNGRMDRGAGDDPRGNARNRPTYATRTVRPGAGRGAPGVRRGPAQAVDAAKLETHVIEALFAALDGTVLADASTTDASVSGDVERIERDLAELAALRGRGEITLAEWMAARKPLMERRDAALAAVATVRSRPARVDALLRNPKKLRKEWSTLPLEVQREVVTAFIDRIIVERATNARHTSIEDRVPVDNIRWRA
ncbi:MAG TPA: recombinase family protein [Acidimicrobiales bacterium]|nr:recombinase family protein [Acidimicrobiales bacterium]